jgi:hypothetical protein
MLCSFSPVFTSVTPMLQKLSLEAIAFALIAIAARASIAAALHERQVGDAYFIYLLGVCMCHRLRQIGVTFHPCLLLSPRWPIFFASI